MMAILCGFIYVFTDPVIHSTSKGSWGPADLGQDGIDNFFAYHKCGKFCSPLWRKPPNSRKIFEPVRGSVLQTSTGEVVGTKKVKPLAPIAEECDEKDSNSPMDFVFLDALPEVSEPGNAEGRYDFWCSKIPWMLITMLGMIGDIILQFLRRRL